MSNRDRRRHNDDRHADRDDDDEDVAEPAAGNSTIDMGQFKEFIELMQLLQQPGAPQQQQPPPAAPSRPRQIAANDDSEVFDDDGEGDEELTPAEIRMARRIKKMEADMSRRTRRFVVRFVLLWIFGSIGTQLMFNWSYVKWWTTENVFVHVQDYGESNYEYHLERFTASQLARVDAEGDRDLVQKKLNDPKGELGGEEKIQLRKELFDLLEEIKQLKHSESYYRSVLDSFREEHGNPEITKEYFRAKARGVRPELIK